MTAQPIDPPSIIPTQTHRIAADRAIRLATQSSIDEALAFYDDMTPGERRVVFSVIARIAGGRTLAPLTPEETSPWWTRGEMTQAHKLFMGGNRSAWVRTGHELYRKAQARFHREHPNEPAPQLRPWTPEEDLAITAPGRPADIVLANQLGRTVTAVESRRHRIGGAR